MKKTDRKFVLNEIQKNVEALSKPSAYIPVHQKATPSVKALGEMMALLRKTMYPGFFGEESEAPHEFVPYHLGIYLEQIYDILETQIFNGLRFETECQDDTKEQAARIAIEFINRLPRLKHLLSTDIKAILDGDPAAKSPSEIIFCYPGVYAIFHQRIAHELYQLGVPVIPRIITEMAHSLTGIDIHPGAQIGEYFSIDHGTGIVIGQTAIIGNHVRLYQGVTLGAKSFTIDEQGLPMDLPRHPILEDEVIVYSNASILGRITIGKGSVIGGNIWLTHNVPPYSKLTQSRVNEASRP